MTSNEERASSYSMRIGPVGTDPLTVMFEPVAGPLDLEPGDWIRLEVSGPNGETVEVTQGVGYISVWPSGALTVKVFDSDGNFVPLLGFAPEDA